jgi:hypothetical protein
MVAPYRDHKDLAVTAVVGREIEQRTTVPTTSPDLAALLE